MTSDNLYPEQFRNSDVHTLIDHLKQHNSVCLIGMKRVGINNFLRYFFQHPDVQQIQIPSSEHHLLINVDLNDLIEKDLFPFWTLTLKRLCDTIEQEPSLSKEIHEKAQKLFTQSIQLKDVFVTVDNIRSLITALTENNWHIILVLNRFDRMQDAATTEFFSNLQSLKDHANRHLSYIFTSYRSLHELRPDVFTKQAVSVFSSDVYLKPTNQKDSSYILSTFEERYKLTLTGTLRDEFISVTGGHVQLIHLSMIKLRESEILPTNREELIEYLLNNEEALLQSEELLDSLTEKEKAVLNKLATSDTQETILIDVPYLTDTGMVFLRDGIPVVFSPLLRRAILRRGNKKQSTTSDFTKKEHILFSYLHTHEGQLCEREDIINAVWPEYAESGVSDWAVDRLVARVRQKLKKQKNNYEILTVITRGYKLIKK